MVKNFQLDSQQKFFKVIVPFVLSIGTSITMLLRLIFNPSDTLSWSILLFAMLLSLDYILSTSHPFIVKIEENNLEFIALFKKENFDISQINNVKVQTTASKKIYLRLNNASLFHGRFWIPYKLFNDGDQLKSYLYSLKENK